MTRAENGDEKTEQKQQKLGGEVRRKGCSTSGKMEVADETYI